MSIRKARGVPAYRTGIYVPWLYEASAEMVKKRDRQKSNPTPDQQTVLTEP